MQEVPRGMKARVFPPMQTRPCDFCLSLQGDSVFADFAIDRAGRVYLVRISYDGYGCCTPPSLAHSGAMSGPDSAELLNAVRRQDVETSSVAAILTAYFSRHQDVLWPDALNDHGLLGRPGRYGP